MCAGLALTLLTLSSWPAKVVSRLVRSATWSGESCRFEWAAHFRGLGISGAETGERYVGVCHVKPPRWHGERHRHTRGFWTFGPSRCNGSLVAGLFRELA